MLLMLFCWTWSLPLILVFTNHPLSTGMILLIQTIIISLITGLMSHNFWFSYILFLVMVGGLLILFIYMTSIASNEKFKFSQNMILLSSTAMIFSLLSLILDQFMITKMININLIFSTPSNLTSLAKYMNYPNNLILYMMFIYLLITLIMIVKVTKSQKGPIRQKF